MSIKQNIDPLAILTDILAPLPKAAEMQQWDKACIELGIPEIILMENAAKSALDVLKSEYGNLEGKYICLYMGNGNNGGDAACLARKLLSYKAMPLIIHLKPLEEYEAVNIAGETRIKHLNMAKACGVPLFLAEKPFNLSSQYADFLRPDIIIDGLLGTGFSGNLREPFLNLIKHINVLAKNSYVLALDIPSGLNAHSGLAQPIAVHAHATISFQAAKPALHLTTAKKYVGKLFVKNIGIPPCIQEKFKPEILLLDKKIAKIIPLTPPNSYKNTFGHVLVIGGSQGLSGAAHLAAKSCLRAGAGLVTVAAPAQICTEIKANSPDIMAFPLYNELDKNTAPISIKNEKYTQPNSGTKPCQEIKDNFSHINWSDTLSACFKKQILLSSSLIIGPGIGRTKILASLFQKILSIKNRPPAIIDADALYNVPLHLLTAQDILTPHPGEAAFLLNCTSAEIQNSRFEALKRLTKLAPCVWVLKGANTLIGQNTKPVLLSPEDIPNLAIAGSGDVLAGCIAALMANKLDSMNSAALAVVLHAEAGKELQKIYPHRGNLASQIADALPMALTNILLKQNI